MIKEAIHSLRRMRYELDSPDLANIGDCLTASEDFKTLCLEIAEEAVERELQADAVAARIAELQERKNRLNRTAQTLRDIVLQCMEIKNETSITSPTLTLSAGEVKKKVEVTDEALIPSRFFKPQPPVLDKKALNEAVLKDGEVIEGTAIADAKTTLSIRRK